MKSICIFQKRDSKYKQDLLQAHQTILEVASADIDTLSPESLFEDGVEVVLSNGLPTEWYDRLSSLKIVTVTIDDFETFHNLCDIVVDPLKTNKHTPFSDIDNAMNESSIENIPEIIQLVKKLDWDSEFFGYNVAIITSTHITDNIMRLVNNFVKENNIRLIQYLCNCHDKVSVSSAEANLFHFADIRITLTKELTGNNQVDLSNYTFRKATREDIPTLKELSKDLYKDSRYFFDGNFQIDKINEFYRSWVDKSVRGLFDDECWCLCKENAIIAFSTIAYDKPQNAHIRLLGVDAEFQGKGIGKLLTAALSNMLKKANVARIFVVTQGRNYAAQNLYQGSGFKTYSTQLWYHKWI